MSRRSASKPNFRFGTFEIDLVAGELYKGGVRISLQEQPYVVLTVLLERAGEVVTREELQQRLWPDGTFVDFDRGLNTAINRLREALGDPAGNPRFIETIPRRGYRFIAEVQDLVVSPAGHPSPEAAQRPNVHSIRTTVVVSAVLGIVAIFAAVWSLANRNRPAESSLLSVQLTSYPGNEREPTFSPDGNQVAFAWDAGKAGRSHIYIRQVASERLIQLTSGQSDDRNPSWSPDGRWIAFIRAINATAAGVVLIPALGGPERKLTELRSPWGPVAELKPPLGHLGWSPDGKWLAITDRNASDAAIGLSLMSVETGDKRKLTSPSAEWFGDFSPSFSPDGRKLAFIRAPSLSVSEIYLLALTKDLTPEAEPERLTTQNCWIANPVWTQNGEEIVFSCGQWGTAGRRLFRIGASGRSSPQLVPSLGEDIYSLAISHSGRRLAYTREGMDWDIWRLDLTDTNRGSTPAAAGKIAQRFLSSTRVDSNPQFSPDGTKIAFESCRSGNSQIWISDADGSNVFQLTSLPGPVNGFPRWSPDGQQIAFHSRPRGQAHIFVVGASGGKPRQLTNGNDEDSGPSWSRNGHWIYFTSRRSGDLEIWKIQPQGGAAVQVTRRGGQVPLEDPAGDVLWYAKGRARPDLEIGLWRAPVKGGQEILVVNSLANTSTYAVTEQGVYFIGPERSGSSMLLQFLDLKTGRITRIAPIEGTPTLGLAVSPDRRCLLYNQMDPRTSDLMLVENFR